MIKPSDKQKAFMDFKPNENTIKLASIRTPNESNPNEALESLKLLGGFSWHNKPFKKSFPDLFNNVEHALLKAQENEKELEFFKKVKTMLKQKDCVLRYVESEDCFATRTMLSGWYKLTPQFVEDNIREEIKPLPAIEKIKQLKEENVEYKKVFEIIKKKNVEIQLLKESETVEDYNGHFIISDYQELTEEEFDTLKRWVENEKRI